nr:LysR substrate-binding domain-containing protein [uncultured Cohaesibacter sp.]
MMRKINLDMAALRTFVTGIEAGSFALAADRLGRSTSAVSAQLKKLESQIGSPLTQKSGRGLALTDTGEQLLSYGRRLIELNDEAISALFDPDLEGWVRVGLQEDFGERLLPSILNQFARTHPKVRIEGRIARNKELREKVANGQLDLALAWNDGALEPNSEKLVDIPLRWLASDNGARLLKQNAASFVPLVALEMPCQMRVIACDCLDRQASAWRIAFESPSLAGLWAATEAGLGIALRSEIGRPANVHPLSCADYGLPDLPSLGVVLHYSSRAPSLVTQHFAAILKREVAEAVAAISAPDGVAG